LSSLDWCVSVALGRVESGFCWRNTVVVERISQKNEKETVAQNVCVCLLSGPRTCVKLLCYTKSVVDACDDGAKHCLSALWINPMLSWLTSSAMTPLHEKMVRIADELHAYVVRGEVATRPQGTGAASSSALASSQANDTDRSSGASSSSIVDGRGAGGGATAASPQQQNEPLAWTALQLPFSRELLDEVC
jgi:hypothetical protein